MRRWVLGSWAVKAVAKKKKRGRAEGPLWPTPKTERSEEKGTEE
jgi:hypothetical protein